ncbi:gamma carbonic anhydrase family protein [Hyphomicrobium sp. xq]|uniref:Gamma carbonic anhydrase family protein n=1 Tax=Hyphomicrobium album TaxID=2665159 RepID=A0A6I3KG84_9HYPH|nr:gamma carbonic anhydrase family protein [Hyphomicrobium album]MTD93186.1 gamma carbonic anhydrase family protein [Hyphomicrobium album]
MPLYELDGVAVETPGEGRYWVAPTAVLIGQVILEDEASVWFGSVLRGDNEPIRVGARSNVQEGCVMHTDPGFPLTVGEDCTIGHMVMLHGCTIGRGSLIGIGSIILNGANIGEECLIGANTLIAEGKEIPPRSMVLGSPGKIVRQLSDEDVKRFGGAAGRYVKNWKRFAAGMKPQA